MPAGAPQQAGVGGWETGGDGAAVMSRETDDNRQMDGTGARGRRASNAHPRPSFGVRQSGTQNNNPGEKQSRVRGPQLRHLRIIGDLGAGPCTHLGTGGNAHLPRLPNCSWTPRGNGHGGHTQTKSFSSDSVHGQAGRLDSFPRESAVGPGVH